MSSHYFAWVWFGLVWFGLVGRRGVWLVNFLFFLCPEGIAFLFSCFENANYLRPEDVLENLTCKGGYGQCDLKWPKMQIWSFGLKAHLRKHLRLDVLEKLTCKGRYGGRSVFGRAGQTHHSLSVGFNQCLSTLDSDQFAYLPYLNLHCPQ